MMGASNLRIRVASPGDSLIKKYLILMVCFGRLKYSNSLTTNSSIFSSWHLYSENFVVCPPDQKYYHWLARRLDSRGTTFATRKVHRWSCWITRSLSSGLLLWHRCPHRCKFTRIWPIVFRKFVMISLNRFGPFKNRFEYPQHTTLSLQTKCSFLKPKYTSLLHSHFC
jgi:hypothetical protein